MWTLKVIQFNFILPQKLINKIYSLVFKESKRMYLRKYPNHTLVLILTLMYLTSVQSMKGCMLIL